MDVVARDRAGRRADEAPAAPRRRSAGDLLPLLLGLVAVASAVLLPFAPVEMSVPTVSWPQNPAGPESTMLELTNQEPLALDVRFSCAAVQAAEDTADGVLLSTLVPGTPAADAEGLLVTARDGELRIVSRGSELVPESTAGGDCSYRIHGQDGTVTVERDGELLARTTPGGDFDSLPDVDVLATSIQRLPSDDDLRVRVTVDDQFNTTPSPVKQALLAVLLISAVGALVALWRRDRRPGSGLPAPPEDAGPGPLAYLVDVVVVGTLLLWWFIAPLSDDDGYYAEMARHATSEGFVSNYYQLLDQSFTPFTWFYRALGWWTEVGDSPVVLRVPALLLGLATWVLLRRFVGGSGALPQSLSGRRGARLAVVVVLGGTFLAWWLPYGMGVRPEAAVGFFALVSLNGVLVAVRKQRLLPLAVAIGAAGVAISCHPTGFVVLGPILVALPQVFRLVRSGGVPWTGVLARAVLLVAPGAFASALAFADGSLNDFLRGQQIFLGIQAQNNWYDEIQRYNFLLTPNPMGSYARRAAVLLGIVALVWFVVLAVAARVRGVRLPVRLLLSGQSLAAAFLLLWITPSKWTHHFGALSGLGPAFLALFLVSAPVLVRRIARGHRVAATTGLGVLASFVVAIALALHGPNLWAYSWAPGMPHPNVPPVVFRVELGNLLLWAVLAGVVVALVHRFRRGRGFGVPSWLIAVPVLVLLFLTVSVGHLVGSFGYATVRTLDGYSPWADALTDPLSRNCAGAGALSVGDVSAARPLTAQGPATAAEEGDAFVSGSGWFAPSPPPSEPGEGVTQDVWGSLPDPGQEDRMGALTSSWFTLPPLGHEEDGERVVVFAAGRLGGGNSLELEYAQTDGASEPRVVRTQALTDGQDSPGWRSFPLDVAAAADDGADAVRLVARDRTADVGGWLAFTGPSEVPMVPFRDLVPDGAPVAEAWQISFLFPCERQPAIRFGITEPAQYGVVWRNGAAGNGLSDNTWQVFRGGLFAPVARTSGVTELPTVLPDWPDVADWQVFRFVVPYSTHAYDLSVDRESRMGWAGPPA